MGGVLPTCKAIIVGNRERGSPFHLISKVFQPNWQFSNILSGFVQTIIKNVGKEVRKTDCCCNGSAPSNLGLLVGSGLDFRLGFRQLGNRKQLKTENVRWACLKQPRQNVSRKPHWIWEQGTFYLKKLSIITLFFLWKVWHYFPVKKRKPDTLEKLGNVKTSGGEISH